MNVSGLWKLGVLLIPFGAFDNRILLSKLSH